MKHDDDCKREQAELSQGSALDFVTMKEVACTTDGQVYRIVYRDVEEIKELLSDKNVLRHLAVLAAK